MSAPTTEEELGISPVKGFIDGDMADADGDMADLLVETWLIPAGLAD